MILFFWWILLKLCPIIIPSSAHNLQTFVLAVFMRLIVFERHNTSTLIFDQHHSATSALVLNLMFFAWAKRWRARAEQFSCFVSNWCCVSFGVAVVMATGGLSNVTTGDGPVSTGLVLSLSNGVLYCRHMVSPTWGGGASSITTHIAGDCDGSRWTSLSCVASKTTEDCVVVSCNWAIGGVIVVRIERSIYLWYNFATSPMCSWTEVLNPLS